MPIPPKRDPGDETKDLPGEPSVLELCDQVELWRYEQLVAAGFPAGAAFILATSPDVDLHAAVELLEHGCPVKVALKILR